jgi:hypothetical protein
MKLFAAIVVFFLVCLMGGFIALAGGTAWGSDNCGLLATITFGVASLCGALTLTYPGRLF